jgi:hypothetical protein
LKKKFGIFFGGRVIKKPKNAYAMHENKKI